MEPKLEKDPNRPFPVQGGRNWKRKPSDSPSIGYGPCTIPWWLAEEVYEVYASKYGRSQSLERMAERGGFAREEVMVFLANHDKWRRPYWL